MSDDEEDEIDPRLQELVNNIHAACEDSELETVASARPFEKSASIMVRVDLEVSPPLEPEEEEEEDEDEGWSGMFDLPDGGGDGP